VTDVRSGKEHEIEARQEVGLVFIDAAEKAYLSITAHAEVQHDHAKAAEIWKLRDNAWWNGPDDPNVCVLKVWPRLAELWDGPSSTVVAIYEFAKTWLTGEKPNLGENRKVTLKMANLRKPSNTYRVIWRAARARQQITFIYKERYREACPTIVGYKEGGTEAVFAFQFGGETSPTSKLPEWRCLTLAEITELRVRSGDWHGGKEHRQTQACIKCIDVDVNIPDTLKHSTPLRFGSPKLRAPRESGE
jgi:hypothetical protein